MASSMEKECTRVRNTSTTADTKTENSTASVSRTVARNTTKDSTKMARNRVWLYSVTWQETSTCANSTTTCRKPARRSARKNLMLWLVTSILQPTRRAPTLELKNSRTRYSTRRTESRISAKEQLLPLKRSPRHMFPSVRTWSMTTTISLVSTTRSWIVSAAGLTKTRFKLMSGIECVR